MFNADFVSSLISSTIKVTIFTGAVNSFNADVAPCIELSNGSSSSILHQ